MKKRGSPGFNDLQLAAKVRNLALTQIYDLLNDSSEGNKTVKMELLKRLAPNLLPRLNEHTGQDGEPLPILGGLSGK